MALGVTEVSRRHACGTLALVTKHVETSVNVQYKVAFGAVKLP